MAMSSIIKTELPEVALLQKYRENGSYTDCYLSLLSREVSFPEYVAAFYTTLLFKAERTVLNWFLSMPSTDEQAQQLADGTTNAWAAWTVEERATNQLLMKDYQGRTRSWFMSESLELGTGEETRLYFGSAVVPIERKSSGQTVMGFGFQTLIGFHKLYSVALLSAATSALRSHGSGGAAA